MSGWNDGLHDRTDDKRTPSAGVRATSPCCGIRARRCASIPTRCRCCRSRAAKAPGWSATTAAATSMRSAAGGPTCSATPNRASRRPSREQARTLEQVILAGCSHRAGGRAGRAAAGAGAAAGRPRAAGQGVLRRQRFGRRRSRAEDGVPLVPQSRRRTAAHEVRRAGERLPRRDHRRAVGRRHSAVPAHLRAAAGGGAVRAVAGCVPRARRPERRRLRRGGRRCAGAAVRRPSRRDLRADPRTARAMRRRHAHARPGVPASARASCATRTACS